jgi:hypothetical protein
MNAAKLKQWSKERRNLEKEISALWKELDARVLELVRQSRRTESQSARPSWSGDTIAAKIHMKILKKTKRLRQVTEELWE